MRCSGDAGTADVRRRTATPSGGPTPHAPGRPPAPAGMPGRGRLGRQPSARTAAEIWFPEDKLEKTTLDSESPTYEYGGDEQVRLANLQKEAQQAAELQRILGQGRGADDLTVESITPRLDYEPARVEPNTGRAAARRAAMGD